MAGTMLALWLAIGGAPPLPPSNPAAPAIHIHVGQAR